MREILFKGFAPNENGEEVIYINDEEIKGDWVFGNLEQIIGENVAFIKNYFVLRGTVSQFTGLLDKNGNKIFENDLVEFENGATYEIIFEDYMFKISNETDKYSLFEIEDDDFKVIGNRWEKELR